MIAAYAPLRARTNADFNVPFTFYASSGSVQNITGWTIGFQCYDEVGGVLAFDASVLPSTITNGGATGVATVNVPESVLKLIAPGVYRADMRAVYGGATIDEWTGEIVIEGGLTQP